MRIAILGTRGIPANYGGFETFAEECSAGLAARGHDVTVYGRSHYVPKSLRKYRDVRVVVLPTIESKYTDTIFHTLLSMLHALSQHYQVMLICNAANSIYAWMPRMLGIPVAINVDGIERRRRKWNLVGRVYYRLCESLSTWFPNAIVTDARVIERYYREELGASSTFIPYGAITEKPAGLELLDSLGLKNGEYFLYVGRFEPENNAHIVVKAFEQVRTSRRLVVVGDAPYSKNYIRRLKSTRDSRILFPGAIYGTGYRQLQAGAFCYVHATEVGGTHPALIEAMGQGNLVIANGTPENAEVLGDAGILYKENDVNDLARWLQEVADSPGRFAALEEAALERALRVYSWENVVSQYEALFLRLANR
ncbi:MAG TPA: glycosyltransferase [Acidobacteriota bacterium]|nr:glycosyltransferase [Acidobacteriota bacterium]